MIADKLLSIVIPSKNNHFLISQQLKCFLRWPSLKKIEIIINDNSDAEFDDNSLHHNLKLVISNTCITLMLCQ